MMMIQRSKLSDRRPLSLPTVPPCPCVLPGTLLASMIALSRSICGYSPGSLPTQRRNLREAVRIVGTISVLFEEILGQELEVSDITVAYLSEVHVVLQQIEFLLEDCSRAGARVWILMKSRTVAAHFGAAVRGIVTALDALPMDTIGVDKDVRESVRLVSEQAWKEKFEVDCRDTAAIEEVHSILDSFEVGTEPDPGVIKRVLDYLWIRNWNDCNDEIQFLEEKIDSKGEKEVTFLSSLLGFLCYCRGVMFEFENLSDIVRRTGTFSCFHLDDFRCPISLELMTDPVTVSTGQTYDRSSIQRWLNAGNCVCPKTGQKLSHKELVANVAAKKLIQEFCTVNGIPLLNCGKRTRDTSKTADPCSWAGRNAVRKLCLFLTRRLVFGRTEQKNNTVREIRLLTKSNIFNRKCLIEVGAIPPLLNLLSTASGASAQENAMVALSKLAKQSDGKRTIISWGGLDPILLVLKKGLCLESRQAAAATIFYLSSMKGNQELISDASDVIPALIDLIRDGRTCGKQNAIVTLFELLLHPGNHQRVLDAGAVPLLINILTCSDKPELLTDTLAVLATLSKYKNGAMEILQTPGLPLVTNLLSSLETREGKEYCVSILLSLCSMNPGGNDIVRALARDSAVVVTLYSILAGGTCHAKKEARVLVKLLLDLNER